MTDSILTEMGAEIEQEIKNGPKRLKASIIRRIVWAAEDVTEWANGVVENGTSPRSLILGFEAGKRLQIRKQAKHYRVHPLAVTCKLDIIERECRLVHWASLSQATHDQS